MTAGTLRAVWLRALLLAGASYVVIGLGFAALDNSPDPSRVRLWRLAAWAVSAAVGVMHVGYEHFRLASTPRQTALHAATAVALGAFGLALAANVHGFLAASSHRRSLLVALVVWPIMTGLPVFLATLGIASLLARFRRSA